MSTETYKETLSFQTEVKQLLHLVIHSLYSNKEIFLRELVSNSSDALDKLRYLALSNGKLYENDSDLKIQVSFDKMKRIIIVTDNGIGMTREEVIENIGTIAKSGTKEFLSQLTGNDSKDARLIGQFGVGFYSAFIIADEVTVNTRRAGLPEDQGVCWQSKGDGSYTIETINRAQRGTEIILHLKKDDDEFLDDWRLRNIITKYSDHIGWPIVMEKPVEASKSEEGKDEVTVEATEEETVNKATALWTLSKKEITDEQYAEFYKHISHDFETPLAWSHTKVEGKLEYTTLLYIPSHAPFDMWNREHRWGLRLYVKRVFIMDDAEKFLPSYLRFIKGIVDSNDLPLNVSREILQDNKIIEKIRSASIKKILGLLEEMAANEKEKYTKFWKQFGNVLKEGPIEDHENKEKIAKLLRFSSTHTDSEEQNVSLDDYISRMKEGQDKIYYVTGDNFSAAKHSPHLEIFREKEIEVLILSDRVDEWLVSHLFDYQGKKLHSVAKGKLDLGELEPEASKEEKEEQEKVFASLTERVKSALGDQVEKVQISNRLTDSPACIVVSDYDMGIQMQRILQAAGQAVPANKPILELNPKHPIVMGLDKEPDEDLFKEWSSLLLDQAILADGGELEDPTQFVKHMNKMFLKVLEA
ncbi:MAG: molecular chaperone HtpG [Proteobacteria bacterium]|nr:molecular chaperone HtpG [Pseudomonadota bacterium]